MVMGDKLIGQGRLLLGQSRLIHPSNHRLAREPVTVEVPLHQQQKGKAPTTTGYLTFQLLIEKADVEEERLPTDGEGEGVDHKHHQDELVEGPGLLSITVHDLLVAVAASDAGHSKPPVIYQPRIDFSLTTTTMSGSDGKVISQEEEAADAAGLGQSVSTEQWLDLGPKGKTKKITTPDGR